MPRVPEDYAAFNKALSGKQLRLWQLTNTRYIMALAGFAEAFNNQLDPEKQRFRNVLRFEITQRPGGGITAVTNLNGPLALIEFTGALPRAKLYPQWQVSTNDQATLDRLAAPAFDPEASVIVADTIPAPAPGATNASVAPVEIVNYEPRKVEMRTQADAPTVLLLNSRYDPNWKVRIDGNPAPLLRCNFIMQGAQIPAGQHEVTFYFDPPARGFWLMFGCVVFGLALCGFLLFAEKRKKA